MVETTIRKGKCRFCNRRTSSSIVVRVMGTDMRAACSECDVLTCQGCCYLHSRCESHPPQPRSC